MIAICDVVKQMVFLTVGHYESFGVCETYVVCTLSNKCMITAHNSRCRATAWPELCENSHDIGLFGFCDRSGKAKFQYPSNEIPSASIAEEVAYSFESQVQSAELL